METYRVIEGTRNIYGTLFLPEKVEGKVPMLIMSHGYNGSEYDQHDIAEKIAGEGIGCYCYDFCGGSVDSKSSGKSTEMSIMTEQEDLRTVIRNIRRLERVDLDKMYLLGESQGGFVTGLTAPEFEKEIAGLFLAFPAFCIPDNWAGKSNIKQEEFLFWEMKLGRKFIEELPDYDVMKCASKYGRRVVLFHGDRDEIVDLSYSERLNKLYKNSELIVYAGQGHGFTDEFRMKMADRIIEEIRRG